MDRTGAFRHDKAGAVFPFVKTADYIPEQLVDYLNVNALAYFRLFRCAVQRVRKPGSGSVISTTTTDVGKLALYNGASGI